MLKIINSVSLDFLANDMLEKVNGCWKKPFEPPVIVFTDSKTEQWFNLYVLKRQNVSMNLPSVRLESFLFHILKTDKNQFLLYPDLLRDLIMQKLLSKESGVVYLDKIKDKDNISNYLNITKNTEEIDYKHLFDFADDLSKLFIEYESTRDNIDDIMSGDDWQKDLYNDIMNDCLCINNKNYYTCPEIAYKNKSGNNGRIVFKSLKQPVFVFGFSGMGQTYRNLLKELGEQADVYVYLQTPKGKSNETNNNIFLKHWAQFGKTNYNLFNVDNATEPERAIYSKNTTLGKLQNAIAQDKNIEDTKTLMVATNEHGNKVYDDTLTITSAPSKIRELEIVHSSICKLLQNKQKNVTLKDILVLAPDINEYKSAIETVFNQIDKNDQEYPFIPISIVDYSGKNSAVLDVLQTLYTILHNGGLSRKTFLTITKNFIIQNRYKISDSDVSDVFLPWIKNMRVFRAHESNNDIIDDWERAVNQLLIAKLTDKPVLIDKNKIEPFSDFNTEEEHTTKFVRICGDIKNVWVNKFKEKSVLNSDDIIELQMFLNDLLALDEPSESKSFKETIIFEKINQKLEQYKEFNVPIPMEYLLLSLIDIASNVRFNTGTIFTSGVTFVSLKANRILPAKYVFLIGMNSDNFPGSNKKIALDRRLYLPQYGDDDVPAKNKNAFLCQLMATENELHISFVDKDLQTDNTFYPSCVLDVLTQYTGVKIQETSIDETRNWDELYTPCERRNKQIYIDLNKNDSNEKTSNNDVDNQEMGKQDIPETVRLKEFEYFLENPLKCYANRVFGFAEDDESNQELEDIELNELAKYELKKRLIKPIVENEEPQRQNYKDILPKEPFAKLEFENVYKEFKEKVNAFKEYHKKNFGETPIDTNYQINIPIEYEYTDKENNHLKYNYSLRGEILMCAQVHNDTGNHVVLYVFKDDEKERLKHFPEMYALVAQNNAEKCIVHIVNTKGEKPVEITKQEAILKLNQFYKRAFIESNKNRQYMPYFEYYKKKKIPSFEELKDDFTDEYKRRFISHEELINPDTDLGFKEENFEKDFEKALEKHKELLDPKAKD